MSCRLEICQNSTASYTALCLIVHCPYCVARACVMSCWAVAARSSTKHTDAQHFVRMQAYAIYRETGRTAEYYSGRLQYAAQPS